MPGICYIVATPIGNLEDMSYRAVRILNEVDLIAAEDTRKSGFLLKHWQIKTPLTSFFAGNEEKKIPGLIMNLKDGNDIALISDAGTPGVSDPGNRLVGACIDNGIDVISVPGPSAVITALAGSGLPTDKFWFEGFLPHKKGRQTRLKFLAELDVSIVLYESPHRILKTLGQAIDFFGADRYCVVGRELTKKFEEFVRGSISEVNDHFKMTGVKGEFVLMIAPEKFKRKVEINDK